MLNPCSISAQSFIPAPRSLTLEEQRSLAAAEQTVTKWAQEIKKRYDLEQVSCSALNGVSCNFSVDGVTLMIGRASEKSRDLYAFLTLGNRIEIGRQHIEVISGKWIKVGDMVELESASEIFPFVCSSVGEGENSFAQCQGARNLAELGSRARQTNKRYVFDVEGTLLAQAITRGKLKVRHNGRLIQWSNLIDAAKKFAEQDFSKVIRN